MLAATIVMRAAALISVVVTTAAIAHASDGQSIVAQQRPGTWTAPTRPPITVPATPPKPVTGACMVTGYGIPRTCTDGLTLQDCLSVAYRVHGVADWQQSQECKK